MAEDKIEITLGGPKSTITTTVEPDAVRKLLDPIIGQQGTDAVMNGFKVETRNGRFTLGRHTDKIAASSEQAPGSPSLPSRS